MKIGIVTTWFERGAAYLLMNIILYIVISMEMYLAFSYWLNEKFSKESRDTITKKVTA